MSKSSYELRPYRFVTPGNNEKFKVVVMATSRRAAISHVKEQGNYSLDWHPLSYDDEGHPPEDMRKKWALSVAIPR